MTEYKLFTQRIGLIGVANLLMSLSGLILLPILTKTLPIEEYGVWVQISVTILLLRPLATLGLPYTMVRFLAAEKDREKIQDSIYSIFILILASSFVLSIFLILIAEPFSSFLGGDKELVKILALIIPIECLNVILRNVFRTFQQIKRHSLFAVTQTYGEVALIVYALMMGYGIYGAVLSLLITKLIFFIAMGFFVIKDIGIKLPRFHRTKEYLAFGLPMVPGELSSWVVRSSDRYLIGFFLGSAFVGYYSPGYTLGAVINMFMAPLGFLLPAVLSKFHDEKNVESVKMYLKYSLKYFLMFTIPAVFGLSLLSKQILIILSTPEIAAQGYLITPFVALSALLLGSCSIIAHIIILVKKTKITGSIWFIAAVMNMGLNFVFIPYFGILGAAITTLIAYIFALVIITYYSFRYIRFDIDFSFIMKSIFASILMSSVIIKWSPVGVLDVLLTIGVCAVVYGAVLLLLKGIKREEVELFKEVLGI